MKNVIIVFTCILCQLSYTQSERQIEEKVRNYSSVNSVQELYETIDENFNGDVEKLKAMYTWFTLHITYEYTTQSTLSTPESIIYFSEEDLARKVKKRNRELVEKTIQRKRGICENIALSIQEMCELFGFEHELIEGHVKDDTEDIGVIPKFKNHVWNAVKIQNEWIVLDATFGIDYDQKLFRPTCNYTYFDISTEKLRLSHYPNSQKWRDIMEIPSIIDFSKKPMFWNVFLNSDAKLVSPIQGELKHKNKIFLTFKDLDESTKITYKFEGEGKTKKPKINRINTFTNVYINKVKEGVLTVYFNNESALAFKIDK
ncbi:transglutaminase domain-containing protein [Tenacibaculum agarivorans]|uniref:transglutaminase domain-containing protein n=1 Tax=Tenacibaculum agarivorans TaxID=1908389 RepID=UPI00094BB766|nr:transglutaminase domain-containing protein [Tenacibaculum agarivorans]